MRTMFGSPVLVQRPEAINLAGASKLPFSAENWSPPLLTHWQVLTQFWGGFSSQKPCFVFSKVFSSWIEHYDTYRPMSNKKTMRTNRTPERDVPHGDDCILFLNSPSATAHCRGARREQVSLNSNGLPTHLVELYLPSLKTKNPHNASEANVVANPTCGIRYASFCNRRLL